MKALVSYRPAQGKRPESGGLLIKSANDSVHGMRVNEESGFRIASPSLARELMDFVDKASAAYGRRLTAPLPPTKTLLADRPSLMRRVPTADTRLEDVIFMMGDWETSGFSVETDSRPAEMAFRLYRLNKRGDGLTPIRDRAYRDLPAAFHRHVHLGKDHYGDDGALSEDIMQITGLTPAMLAYEPGPVDALNELNRWIRLVEERTGKVVIFGGHNVASFDRRMHNDFNRFHGVAGNPFLDGDVLDTLVGLRSIEPSFQGTRKLFPSAERWAKRLGVRLASSEAHHADDDTVMSAHLASMQLSHLARKLGNLNGRTWGDIRETFIPKRELKRDGRKPD
jgi:DNA polymerase III epsilon subunit-like protein